MADLLNTAQVAEILGASVATVNRKAANGELPRVKLPGLRGANVFDRAEIEAIAKAEPEPAEVA